MGIFRRLDLALTMMGLSSMHILPVMSQFGVAGRNKRGSSFEELNEMAKKQQEPGGALGGLGGAGGLDDILNMDSDEMAKMVQEMLGDEGMAGVKELLGGLDGDTLKKNMGEALKLLNDPDALTKEIQKAANALNSEDTLNALMQDKDKFLDQMAATGLLTDEILEQYRKNPDKIAEDMKEAMGMFEKAFKDPETWKMMSDLFQDPGKLLENLGMNVDDFGKFLQDDDKIEEARLQLLKQGKDGEKNPLSAMFDSEEMREIMSDPVKWRENVKKGQGMLFGAKAGVGEEL